MQRAELLAGRLVFSLGISHPDIQLVVMLE